MDFSTYLQQGVKRVSLNTISRSTSAAHTVSPVLTQSFRTTVHTSICASKENNAATSGGILIIEIDA